MKITQVTEGIFRGPRPETMEDFRVLLDAGISHCLDLQGTALESLTKSANEREFRGWSVHIDSVRIAMNDLFPPGIDDVLRAIAVIHNWKPIYVHCKLGVDRTGYVIAAYRMNKMGWSYDDAVTEMKSLGFHPWYFYWLPSLRAYEKKR